MHVLVNILFGMKPNTMRNFQNLAQVDFDVKFSQTDISAIRCGKRLIYVAKERRYMKYYIIEMKC